MAKMIAYQGKELTLPVTVKLTGSLMEMANNILDACNEVGCLATTEALNRFDTDGSPLHFGGVKWTARVKGHQTYQTPYGRVTLSR